MYGGGSDNSVNIKIEGQVMIPEGHSFCCNDYDLLSTRTIHFFVFNLLF